MQERDWLVPSTLLTVFLAAIAFALMPIAGYRHPPSYLGSLTNWIWLTVGLGAFLAAVKFLMLVVSRTPRPLSVLVAMLREQSLAIACIAAGMLLAGVDMIFFMWVKPEIASLRPFWADPMLAEADHRLFGRDPWRFFEGVDLGFLAYSYNFFWVVAILLTLIWLFARPRSVERSASIINYFLLWSLFGPIGQYFLSSCGPIFYARAGMGTRFDGLRDNIPRITNQISDYLWKAYSGSELSFAAGISAMPSLHITMATWIALVFVGQRSRIAPLAIGFALYIWVASVALGWHYALDGLVGGAGALAGQAFSRGQLRARHARATSASPRPALA